MKVRRFVCATAGALAAVLCLPACTPLAAVAPSTIAARTRAPAFELGGRISASDGQQAASGRIEWQHDPASERITLLTPLGQVAARLDANALGARLETADGQLQTADSAAALLPRVLGVDVPVERLGGWVQAAPDSAAEVRTRDAAGRPALVIDQGWRIDYLDYSSDAADAPPARLDISRGDARIRLLIDAWTTLP